MSFLLRRNRPVAKIGHWDNFNRANENPVKWPWASWGESVVAQIVDGSRLYIGDNDFLNTGGVGYEHEPLTSHWGVEFHTEMSTYGSDTNTGKRRGFNLHLSNNWTDPAVTPNRYYVQFSMYHDANGDKAAYRRVSLLQRDRDAVFDFGAGVAASALTQAEWAKPIDWRIECIDDRTFIVWMDNVPKLCGTVTNAANYCGPHKRACNFQKISTQDLWLDNFGVYDIVGGFPTWSSYFYDDFNRSNGAVGNGWTVLGSAGKISSNTYATTGGTDGGKAIIRSTGITTGKQLVEAAISGPSAHEQGIVLCSNSAGTQGLICRVTSSNAKIFRFSTALTGNPPTFTELGINAGNIGFATGDIVSFYTTGAGRAFAMKNYTQIAAYAEGVHSVVPASNPYAGLFVSRSTFVNSGAWDVCAVYTGA